MVIICWSASASRGLLGYALQVLAGTVQAVNWLAATRCWAGSNGDQASHRQTSFLIPASYKIAGWLEPKRFFSGMHTGARCLANIPQDFAPGRFSAMVAGQHTAGRLKYRHATCRRESRSHSNRWWWR